jgi:GT2 family glycosyltransferase
LNRLYPKTTLITVNFNGKNLLKTYLDSVFSLKYPKDKLEVIVVDNSSTDGSPEFIRKHYPKAKLIKSPLNNYCHANNLAIKQAKGKYIGLINNDVRLDKNWLCELLKVMDSQPKIGAVTGKVLFANKRINSTGHIELPNLYWADRGFKEKDRGQYNRLEQIQSLSHCACLYRKEALRQTGPLDEDFNMYLEDIDMSIRLRQKAWQLYYVPKAICIHKFHGTIDRKTLIYQTEKNRLLLIAKHSPSKLEAALFNDGYFSMIGKLDKKFSISVLNLIKLKVTDVEQDIDTLINKCETFYHSESYKFLVRPFRYIRNFGIIK